MTAKWKVGMIRGDGKFYFQGPESLVLDPDEAKWFEDMDSALKRVRDIACLPVQYGVVQFRIISEYF